ncbi:hypothetical protein LSCM1_05236 [Leishmania martiniquensis]|uniref:Uncharacterized protein n=1 Tax=Leishmania martiniquensis TaxID=1580590 RepID=A0A836GQB5_9TRYP|nr:hypothetical protein LSCM1_05236 [Leishmania martiniquensis]
MQRLLKNFLYKTLVLEGSNTPLVKRAAEKAARMERDFAAEKLGLWLGAAVREVSNDISSSYKTLRTYLSRDAAQQPQTPSSTAREHVGTAGGGSTPSQGR